MKSDEHARNLVCAEAPFPRLALIAEPSPLLALRNFSDDLRSRVATQVWAKREDLIPLGLGGNKLRNMEFLLAEARGRTSDKIIVFGRPGSNHCRLAAAAAAHVSLPATVVFSGHPPTHFSAGEALLRLLGAEVLYTDDERPTSAAALAVRERDRLRVAGSQPYLMPPGASGVLGASGHVVAGLELAAQVRTLQIPLDFVFVGMATGGTVAGVRVGLALAGMSSTTVVGVPTHLALAESSAAFEAATRNLTQTLLRAWNSDGGTGLGGFVVDGAPWNRYGTMTADARLAQARIGATEGLLLDPIYTAHAAASLVRWAQLGKLDGATVALWVGGGLPALFDPELSMVAS